MYRAKIYVTLKESVLDPQGKTIKHALESLEFHGIEDVRLGKYFVITMNMDSEKKARDHIENMCRKLLVNPVIETFSFDLEKMKDK
ncbi:MAG: phosphoribosylformylglycinamidine synthase subunit PurS [Candidatus Aureabacteria bacterium]|nr:phosphoribosylformylglycinamidine synthase subunit PurS [Candidatus Auribacterota bacterium]